MVRVVGIDHLVIRVSDFEKSKAFYDKLLKFLGFKVLGDYGDQIGWTNGKTRLWIGQADDEGLTHKYRIGDIGFHHYAFELRNRKDVDDLQIFLKEEGVTIVDPADEYYDDYYAVFFLDPDGLKLEGMKWGEERQKAAQVRTRAAAKKKAAAVAKKKVPPRKSAKPKTAAKPKKAVKTRRK
jgi:catechol 2,3-dioxygenase-like lactoylglutathione lyase family enzyme